MDANKIIIPTNGRQVWFFGLPNTAPSPTKLSEQPMAATVVHVWNPRCVNLDVVDHMGEHYFVSSCDLLQAGDTPVGRSYWAEWVPQPAKPPQGRAEWAAHVESLNAPGSVPPLADLTFGTALERLKRGAKIARAGWNGKGMWLELQSPDAHSKMTLPYIFMSYPHDAANTPGARVPWLASQTDMLAQDWVELA